MAAGGDLAELETQASHDRLTVMGALNTLPEDAVGPGVIALLGPAEPGFWPHVTSSPEFADGAPDPLDRWSTRVVENLAAKVGGKALFPFGTPRRPFFSWALRSGRAWQSPVLLLVHDTAGLMVSYRGAVLLPDAKAGPAPARNPCETCEDRPCLTACPARALTEGRYDVDACHAFLDTEAGRANLQRGCAVRRACPLSQVYGRSEAQSAFHMKHFHR